MKPATDYQPRINRRKMREEGVAALAITAVIEGVAQIFVTSIQSRYAETVDLPWEGIRLGLVAIGTATALAFLAGERDKDQFHGLEPILRSFLKTLKAQLAERLGTRI